MFLAILAFFNQRRRPNKPTKAASNSIENVEGCGVGSIATGVTPSCSVRRSKSVKFVSSPNMFGVEPPPALAASFRTRYHYTRLNKQRRVIGWSGLRCVGRRLGRDFGGCYSIIKSASCRAVLNHPRPEVRRIVWGWIVNLAECACVYYRVSPCGGAPKRQREQDTREKCDLSRWTTFRCEHRPTPLSDPV